MSLSQINTIIDTLLGHNIIVSGGGWVGGLCDYRVSSKSLTIKYQPIHAFDLKKNCFNQARITFSDLTWYNKFLKQVIWRRAIEIKWAAYSFVAESDMI